MNDLQLIEKFEKQNKQFEKDENDLVKAWYNPELRGFEFFLATGEKINFCTGCSVTVDDNWGQRNSFNKATINLLVKIVNEKP